MQRGLGEAARSWGGSAVLGRQRLHVAGLFQSRTQMRLLGRWGDREIGR
ncbi:MAG: hypothetical protein F6J99_13715 [Moorea sp. SIO4G3]|nr:hypothetical protein [Moorena sp. SIO4G3]